MRKTQQKKSTYKKRKTIRKKRGGDCGCNKKPLAAPMIFGGYGAASYQGGLDGKILPLNNNVSSNSDPSDVASIHQERFKGGKKRYKKKKGGMSMDVLLGDSATTNPFLGTGTSSGSIKAAHAIMGK